MLGTETVNRRRRSTTQKDMDPRSVMRGLHRRGTWRHYETNDIRADTDSIMRTEAKYGALLSKDEFLEFARSYGLDGRSLCDTGGCAGMPGAEPWYATMPAWSVDGREWEERGAHVNAYITPYPEIEVKTKASCNDKNVTAMKRWLQRL